MTVPTSHEDPDAELLARMVRGDQAAFAALVDRHLAALHRLAQRLLGSSTEADDVTQDVFLRAWERASSWQAGTARYSTWLYQVALNQCRDRLRSRRPTETLIDDFPDLGASPEQQLAELQHQRRLREALAALPERQREALTLFHFEGLSQQQAAQVIGVSEDALESLLARARRSLRQQLAPTVSRQHLSGS
jgi:RNA polymerase sigma-70 factor (ECF subfamily)